MEMYGIDQLGIQASQVHHNLCAARLVKKSLERGEATLSSTGALSVETGKYTGRSPYDKYIVDSPAVHDRIHWGSVNRPIDRRVFNRIKGDMIEYLNGKEVFIFDGFAGADIKYTRKIRVINEKAWQNLFIHNLLIRPTEEQLEEYGEGVHLNGNQAVAFARIRKIDSDFERTARQRKVLIGIFERVRAMDPLALAATEVVAGGVDGVALVDVSDVVCGPESCPGVVGGLIGYFDHGHLTATFARTLRPWLEAGVDEALG